MKNSSTGKSNVPIFVLSLVVLIASLYFAFDYKKKTDFYEETEARYTSYKYYTDTDSDDMLRECYDVTYTYTVDGVDYEYLNECEGTMPSERSTITVKYNPNDPSMNSINSSSFAIVFAYFGIIGCIIAIASSIKSHKVSNAVLGVLMMIGSFVYYSLYGTLCGTKDFIILIGEHKGFILILIPTVIIGLVVLIIGIVCSEETLERKSNEMIEKLAKQNNREYENGYEINKY